MLIIAGHIRVASGGRDAVIDASRPMVAATLNEPGCQEYAFTIDPNDDDRILLYELWDDEDALAGHFASDHMAAWQALSKDLPLAGAAISKYTVASVDKLR